MIVYLEGILHRKEPDSIILLVNGVGYQVFVSRPTWESLPETGSELSLQTHQVIREDHHQLFGFLSETEKTLFLKLIQVSSIGPKMALTILSGMPAQELAQAIHHEDLVRLTAIPGIGKKTAERLVVDLKDKIIELVGASGATPVTPLTQAPSSLSEEALSALMNLGYSRQEAGKAIQAIPRAEEMTLEVLVREGLKALS
ncbi:MAG: Holliday junction branch migration protein RuvA [bacterium]|nr:Holliday junction branch migration protein RuvA [bacterium]